MAPGTPNPIKEKQMNEPVPWTIADCLAATGGELYGEDPGTIFSKVSIDSRRISKGDLFVAIKGEVHDGHRFANEVVRRGISGLILEKSSLGGLPCGEWAEKAVVIIAVGNTTKALGDLAVYHRRRNRASILAITGSNGKTTTRRMSAAVVSRGFTTLSTRKNFNNNIGLPLTLLELLPAHQWAVVELGMNAPGEIDYLAGICEPDIGVITNIGPAHLEGVGSLDGVMKAKGELLGKIKTGGTAVLNADDQRLMRLAEQTSGEVLLYGLSDKAQVRALDVTSTNFGSTFTLVLSDKRISVDLKIPGKFMISNALAAAAAGHNIGLSPEQIKKGLEDFTPAPGRMNLVHTRVGIHIIDDTYNANPGSMAAAFATLKALHKNHRAILVIGDMKELGEHAESLHLEVGALAARSGIDRLYATGDFAKRLAAGAAGEGMKRQDIFTGSKQEILELLTGRLNRDDWVLVKGSRSMAMEEIVQGLLKWANK